ncbi:MAG: hypothetical protein IPN17_06175 [Deltaproteobacteria bacterium]|nr:hypothetical protein [Deltaproteobacteria bacterium]
MAFSLLFSACAPLDDAQDTAVQEVSGRPVCQYVKCAYPLCAEGQNLVIPQGQCCPVCRGPSPSDRCATVLCAAVACGEGRRLDLQRPEGRANRASDAPHRLGAPSGGRPESVVRRDCNLHGARTPRTAVWLTPWKRRRSNAA